MKGRRENEVLKLLFLSPVLPLLSVEKRRDKKRPFTGYVFHFERQVQRHWEIWALCVGLEGSDERAATTSNSIQLPAHSAARVSSKTSGCKAEVANPHKSTLAGEKLFLELKWVKGLARVVATGRLPSPAGRRCFGC